MNGNSSGPQDSTSSKRSTPGSGRRWHRVGTEDVPGYVPATQRPGASLVVICAMAGAVAVLICVFAMAGGFTRTLLDTAHDDRAIVLSTDARSEMGSVLPIEWAPTILNAPGVRKAPGNTPLASAEMLSLVRLTDRRTGLDAFATMRGLGSEGLALRPEIRIIEGRMFERGKLELIVGRSIQHRLEGLAVGDRLLLPQGEWTVVGAFESGGDSHQSELLTDVSTLLNAAKRKVFSSITVALDGPAGFQRLQTALDARPELSVKLLTETEYFSQAAQSLSRLLKFVAYGIGGCMLLGALAVALNAMYSSVSTRVIEIATLRALGFSSPAIVTALFLEALVLSLIGALIGAGIAWTFFQHKEISTLTGASAAQLTYSLQITAPLVASAVAVACVVGLSGGLLPALRATRLGIAVAIRKVA